MQMIRKKKVGLKNSMNDPTEIKIFEIFCKNF